MARQAATPKTQCGCIWGIIQETATSTVCGFGPEGKQSVGANTFIWDSPQFLIHDKTVLSTRLGMGCLHEVSRKHCGGLCATNYMHYSK